MKPNTKNKKVDSMFFKRYFNKFGNGKKLPADWFDQPMEPNLKIDLARNMRKLIMEITRGNVDWGDLYLFDKMAKKHNDNVAHNIPDDTTTINGIYNNGYLVYFSSINLRTMLLEEARKIMFFRKMELYNAKVGVATLKNPRNADEKEALNNLTNLLNNKQLAYNASVIIYNSMVALYKGDIMQLGVLSSSLKTNYPVKAITNDPDSLW